MAKQLKLKALLEDVFSEQPQVNKYEVTEGVKSFGIVGKSLYNNSNIMEIAKQLSHIAEQAHTHVVSETSDWFDKVSVNNNMKSLKNSVTEFKKAAVESHQLNQRLTGLYEDIGHVLNRYYEIDEADKGDMDNDGKDEPDSEEYLDSKRDAITKAVKKESKSIILVILLSVVLNLEQVDNLFKMQPSLFVTESGLINMQGILIKAIIIGILYYVVKSYLF